MSIIKKKGDSLFGIKYWAQHYLYRHPRYEVFTYIGRQEKTGLYYFKSMKESCIIGKKFDQLNVGGFVPFCLDFEAIMNFLAQQDEEKRNAPV